MANKTIYPVVDGKKECGDCHEVKPITEYHKDKKFYTRRCKLCAKAYAAAYRQKPEIKIKNAEYAKKYKDDPKKREMINRRSRKLQKTEKYKIRRNKNRKEWCLKQKKFAVDYKGGKCFVCGYYGCFAALDFHHIDPSQKDGYGTGALKAHWTFERCKEELDKCVLLCVRCHREIHAGYKKL